MKFRYKILAGIMSVISAINMAATAFADNPLQLSDRITQDAENARLREEEIKNKRIQQQSTKSSYVNYGTTLQGNDSIAFYINRKNMTKKEYDAFKWSFIFSQFARPLQDGLLDVFNQDSFREMIEKDFNITSVKTTLTNSQLNPNTDTVLQAMLDDVNFTELEDTIRDNYAYYFLHDGNGTAATLSRLVNTTDSKVDPLGVVYYIYDTQLSAVKSQEDLANALLYNQHILGDENVTEDKLSQVVGKVSTTEVPVFTVTSQVFLYLQLAVASYLMDESCQFENAEALVSYWGDYPLVIDSYGNICVLDSGKPVILVPNFGNPLLTASYSRKGEYTNTTTASSSDDERYTLILRERIDFYNSWITSFYTRNQRAGNKIYNKKNKFTVVGSIDGDLYSQLVKLPSKDKTAGSIALVEASDIYSSLYFGKDTGIMAGIYNVDQVLDDYTNVVSSLAAYHSTDFYEQSSETSFYLFKAGDKNRVDGHLVSPVNTHFTDGAFAPFTATSKAKLETYKNPNPLVVGNVDINRYDTKGEDGRYTCYNYLISASITNKVRVAAHEGENLSYIIASMHTGGSTTEGTLHVGPFKTPIFPQTDDTVVINPNVLLFVPACFDESCIIKNPGYTSNSKPLSNGITREMYTLPKEAVDVGQYMDAYISDEKGMLLAECKRFFGGELDSLKHYLWSIGNCFYGKDDSDDDITVSTGKSGVKLTVGNMRAKYSTFAKSDDGSSDYWSFQTTWEPPLYDKDKLKSSSVYQFFGANADGGWSSITSEELCDSNLQTRTKAWIKAIGCVMCKLDDEGITSSEELQDTLQSMCKLIKWDYNEFITFVAMYAPTWPNDKHVTKSKTGQNTYFFDQYWYYLRNTANLSDSIHAEANKDTFASTTYYWDRYYLLNTAFNVNVGEDILAGWEKKTIAGKNLMASYEDYLKKTGKSKNDVSLSKYKDEIWQADANNLNSKNILNTYKVNHPSVYEATLQSKMYEEYLASKPADYKKFEGASQWYDYLTDDTVVVYPFGHDETYSLRAYYGHNDTVAFEQMTGHSDFTFNFQTNPEGDGEDTSGDNEEDRTYSASNEEATISDPSTISFNPTSLMLSLQKNTDTEHNSIVAEYKPVKNESQVTKEELMNKANRFFTNPVTSISYIITGFLYRVHDAIATGNIGNVFSISWLTETKPYKWIISRYVALMTIILVALLILKMTQLLMSKTHDFSTIGKSVVGILAMGIVPVMILNSFVWAFDSTSKWALGDSYNKVLLSQVERGAANVNNDAAVDAELTAFKEQFDNLSGNYNGAAFEFLIGYNAGTGATYKTESLDTILEHTRYNTSYDAWYQGKGFEAVHEKNYNDSLYYYFYDYIRCAYFDYCKKHKTDTTMSGVSTFIDEIYNAANAKHLKSDKEAQKKLQAAEQGFLEQNGGGFREMLYDTAYVYGPSADKNAKTKYGGPCVKDLVGLYNIFRNESLPLADISLNKSLSKEGNTYLRAYANNKNMVSNDKPVPDTWLQNAVISDYAKKFDSTKRTGIEQRVGNGKNDIRIVYPVFTSKLDAFNTALNPSGGNISARYDGIPLTPLEEKLCNLSEDIYETTLKCLNYLPGQVHDESAITMMALIATFKTNQLFDVEPQNAILDTITLDSVVRAAFVTDLTEISSSSHTLYAMVEQGDSVGKIALVVVLELIICISSIARVAIVLFLTGATFVVLALRLLNKTPKTTDLIYGVVGNLLALIFLHALTLFLVVIAVEWVANATSAIPGLVLDVAMILFVVLMVKLLMKLVKNIVLDVVNMGGTMFRNITHKIANGIVNVAGKLFNKGDAAFAGATVDMSGARVNEMLANDRAQRKAEDNETRMRTELVIRSLERVEAEEAAAHRAFSEAPGQTQIHTTADASASNSLRETETPEQGMPHTDLTAQIRQTAQREASVQHSSSSTDDNSDGTLV